MEHRILLSTSQRVLLSRRWKTLHEVSSVELAVRLTPHVVRINVDQAVIRHNDARDAVSFVVKVAHWRADVAMHRSPGLRSRLVASHAWPQGGQGDAGEVGDGHVEEVGTEEDRRFFRMEMVE